MKSDIERGQFGTWARKARMAKGWASAEKAVGPIEEATGHRMRADYLRGIEAGTQTPGPETVAALEAAYDSTAPPIRRPSAELAFGDALSELVTEVRLSRVAQETVAQSLGELTGMVAALLARADMRVGPTPPDGVDTRSPR